MNRERLLFVVVLAILALWYFVLREPAEVRAGVRPRTVKLAILKVGSGDLPERDLKPPDKGIFTRITNENPHPRPLLDPPERRDLSDIRPPTSFSVAVERYGILRRPAAKPQAGEPSITLPEATSEQGGEAQAPADERVDHWTNFSQATPSEGRIVGLLVGGTKVEEPESLPAPGAAVLDKTFFYYAALLEVDPQRAANLGVTQVEARFKVGATMWQKFPDQIHSVVLAVQGRQKGWWEGLRGVLRLPAKGFQPRLALGRKFLQDGVNAKQQTGDQVLLEWALFVLDQARAQAHAQQALGQILELMLEAAKQLNRQEEVLTLAFEHLARFPRDARVLEYVGNILASRSFGLLEMAEDFFARAPSSSTAQQRHVEVLIRLGRYAEAQGLLDAGRAGSGPEIDLLRAQVALARGDFDTAKERAGLRASGDLAATAQMILGGVAYAEGDAAAAAAAFLKAIEADPARSRAYSDLGLALAVQGKVADAAHAFEHAAKLDPIDNAVTPRLGRAYSKLAGGDFDGAATDLQALASDNPADLLVRYYLAYATERTGDLEAASKLYRSILDDDYRYRIAIARLGLVEARRVEAGDEGANPREAEEHLRKAVELNPGDPVLPYLLGRFMMVAKANPGLADRMFAACEKLPAPEGDAFLPLWAQAARAALLYRDDSVEEGRIKTRLQAVLDAVRDMLPPGTPDKELAKNALYAYTTRCLVQVKENETKVDKTWRFPSEPRDWSFHRSESMRISTPPGKGVLFSGQVDYKGRDRNKDNLALRTGSIEFPSRNGLTGGNFYELTVEGILPENPGVYLGVGLLDQRRSAKRGWSGIQVRRRPRDGLLELRLAGGENDLFNRMGVPAYIKMDKVVWPAGKFKIHIAIQGGDNERRKGRFTLMLNDTNVFETQLDQESERSLIFSRSGSNRGIAVLIWVEGNEGVRYGNIYITKVVMTKKAKE